MVCSAFTDGAGRFAFADVPARTYTITARDPVSSLAGATGGTLVPGQTADVRVVLEPSALVTGRVVLSDGRPAAGAAIEVTLPPVGEDGPRGFFRRALADGTFRFDALPLAQYTLTARDPLGTGVARRFGALIGNLDLGDLQLDEAAPSVVQAFPLAGAVQVARNARSG